MISSKHNRLIQRAYYSQSEAIWKLKIHVSQQVNIQKLAMHVVDILNLGSH